MLKIIYNNMIIDVVNQEKYVRYLPKLQRVINSEKQIANGIMGSDNNTIYHLRGTINNFPYELKSVNVQRIDKKEYEKLTTQLMLEKSQESDLRQEVDGLKAMIKEQNSLIQQLLAKLG